MDDGLSANQLTFLDSRNLDPALMAMDPLAQLMAQVRPPSPPPLNDNDSDDFPLGPFGSSGSNGMPSETAPPLDAFAKLVKHRLGLKDQEAMKMDAFVKTTSLDERLTLLYGELLDMKSTMSKSQQPENFIMSTELKTVIKSYAFNYLLHHSTMALRGTNDAEHILLAMRDYHASILPSKDSVGRNEVVLGEIRAQLTSFRNVIKTKVKTSMEKTSNGALSSHRNIADLARAVTANVTGGFVVTIYTYLRLALIRWVTKEYPGLKSEEFWPRVNESLLKMRTSRTEAEFISFLTMIYNLDQAEYGQAQDSITKVTLADISTLPQFVQDLGKHAAKVTTILPGQGTKRARETMESPDGDGSGIAGGSDGDVPGAGT
ncbi:hypothetical protein GGX14DRAFT_392694 [Mycena pura]|uniref:Uncharacterized protein n=1 Tax=Mycena pura TaxID=153505 RepID=A0AAD6YDR4_9AGAR|nr:hypothetical protein GGX14DRAFT_392694 [Mycena pura]